LEQVKHMSNQETDWRWAQRRRIPRRIQSTEPVGNKKMTPYVSLASHWICLLLFLPSLVGSFAGVFAWHPSATTILRGYRDSQTMLYLSNQPRQRQRPSNSTDTATQTRNNDDDDDDDDDMKAANRQDLVYLQAQAAKLREEAKAMQLALQEEKEAKLQREREKVDGWIHDLLIQSQVNDNTELLKTVDQVLEKLTDDRYSAEQVYKIFYRLSEVRYESRSQCSPLMSLLVDAAGKLDCTERQENPNKRWNHKVERELQKKLFARDWNIELENQDDEDDRNPWKIQ